MKVWLDGKLVDKAQAALSIFDHATLYGDGVFEGIRSYNGKIFQSKAHLDRLFCSAEYIELAIPYSADELEKAMYETMEVNGLADCYIRLVVTRGAGALGVSPKSCSCPTVFIVADQIELYPQELYDNGMPVIIGKTIRPSRNMLNPEVKSLNYLNNIMAKLEGYKVNVSEVLMKNVEGNICEASADNVFIVKDGRLLTPPREAGILMGITRSVIMRLARKQGIEAVEENMTPEDIYAADECFLTGTAAELVPVTVVDGKTIGDGKVGEVSRLLLAAFKEFIDSDEQIEYDYAS